jgi:predicted nucleic acid-binding protein
MIVVADASPLNYLTLIGEIELLAALYQKVVIPGEVHRELQQDRTPQMVRAWAGALPPWCEVRFVVSVIDPELDELDPGERDAIQLALEIGVDTVLMDEVRGRREALRRRLHVTGTVAVLEKAGQQGLIDFQDGLRRLEGTNFRLSPTLRDEFLKRNS